MRRLLFLGLIACPGAHADGAFAGCSTDADCDAQFQCLVDALEPGVGFCTLECSTEKDCYRLGWDAYCKFELGICCSGDHHGDICDRMAPSEASGSGT
jgi:hypothetical protein